MTRAKKKNGSKAQRVKPPTPSRATEALIGGEEQNGKQYRRKRKDRRTWKSRREEKVFGLAQPSYSHKEMVGSHQGGNLRAIGHPTRLITQGAGIVKGWEDR